MVLSYEESVGLLMMVKWEGGCWIDRWVDRWGKWYGIPLSQEERRRSVVSQLRQLFTYI